MTWPKSSIYFQYIEFNSTQWYSNTSKKTKTELISTLGKERKKWRKKKMQLTEGSNVIVILSFKPCVCFYQVNVHNKIEFCRLSQILLDSWTPTASNNQTQEKPHKRSLLLSRKKKAKLTLLNPPTPNAHIYKRTKPSFKSWIIWWK